jgi:hypothetical protein
MKLSDFMTDDQMKTLIAGAILGAIAPEQREKMLTEAVGNLLAPKDSGMYGRTLAIGDHDQHEDLANGVRWEAKPLAFHDGLTSGGEVRFRVNGSEVKFPYSREDTPQTLAERAFAALGKMPAPHPEKADSRAVTGARTRQDGSGATSRPSAPCSGCGGTVVCACHPNVLTVRRPMSAPPSDRGHRILFEGDGLLDLATITAPNGGPVVFACACGSADPACHREGCALPWQYRMAATWAIGPTDAHLGLSGAVGAGLLAACAVALLAWCCRLWDERHDARRAAEAPLVALVNACPEGLDPVGWKAAVLAADEHWRRTAPGYRWEAAPFTHWLRVVLSGKAAAPDSAVGEAAAAYRRALTPHKAPPPERKAWGPRLTVDDGRDE